MSSALEFSSNWSLGEVAYQAILEDLRSIGAKTIVEFGSGTSTLRLSRDLPDATILSIEGDLRYLEETRKMLDALGGSAVVELSHRPVRWQQHGVGCFLSYESGPFPPSVDGVLIDGPPIQTRRGREACLYQVFHASHPGTRFYLDDYERPPEQQIVRNWRRAYPNALVQRPTFESGHRIAVLERTAATDARRRTHLLNVLDSLVENAKHVWRS